MELDQLLDRCRALEERAASLYRSYARGARSDPAWCTLWTALAREEEAHAQSLAAAHHDRDPVEGWRTRLDGWDDALAEIEERLATAERLSPGAPPDHLLAAALALEMTELEGLRHVLLAVSKQPVGTAEPAAHAERLAAAAQSSEDPQVRLQAALLRARARL